MKRLALVVCLTALLPRTSHACPKGEIEYEGTCASLPSPDESTLAPAIQTSDEKPPSDKMPSYEREGIHADTPQSQIAVDLAKDREKAKAIAIGKKKAGIPLTDEEKELLQDEAKK